MGVHFYLVDEVGKRALGIGKTYAFHPEDRDNVTAADVEASRVDDDDRKEGLDLETKALVTAWLNQAAGPVSLFSDLQYDYLDVCEPWWKPHPKYETLRDTPLTVREGWTFEDI
jgi:hypothetical protein